ncbi:MAG: plasmid pRiA4b ORF-3 family protein [Candidatus Aenigmarchaeota archaeon]|nr:plasmid pRiA4b ORF-3 family protein [Candidatus Aenigmarchaeota archaeon]
MVDMPNVMHFRIELDGSRPAIWRRFVVGDSITFHALHKIIQVVMGWEDSHLYEFSVQGMALQIPDPDEGGPGKDPRRVRLSDVLKRKGQQFSYLYDFGDGWEHTVVLEAVSESGGQKVPRCVGGSMACPPEDCGGLGGYDEMLDIRKNKKHPEYQETVEWLGEGFDPERFNADAVNKRLARLG